MSKDGLYKKSILIAVEIISYYPNNLRYKEKLFSKWKKKKILSIYISLKQVNLGPFDGWHSLLHIWYFITAHSYNCKKSGTWFMNIIPHHVSFKYFHVYFRAGQVKQVLRNVLQGQKQGPACKGQKHEKTKVKMGKKRVMWLNRPGSKSLVIQKIYFE